MLKKYLKVISSGLFYTLSSVVVLLLCFLIWLKIHPRDINFIKSYILESSKNNLPQNTILDINNVQIHLLDGYFKPTISLREITIEKDEKKVAGVDKIAITADLYSIFDNANPSMLHVKIEKPMLDLQKPANKTPSHNPKNIPLKEINAYIKKIKSG